MRDNIEKDVKQEHLERLSSSYNNYQDMKSSPHYNEPLIYGSYSVADYHVAVSGKGPKGYEWRDKPHRLVYDLCRTVLEMSEDKKMLEIECAKLAENVDILETELKEEISIVDRICGMFGSPTYEQLAGRSIYDLIAELQVAAHHTIGLIADTSRDKP